MDISVRGCHGPNCQIEREPVLYCKVGRDWILIYVIFD